MKNLFALAVLIVATGVSAFGQETAKQEAKQAVADAQSAGKSAGHAAKHSGKGVAKGTKKGVNKAAAATEKDAAKVKDKTAGHSGE